MIVLRPPEPGDRGALVTLRDDHFKRFMGEGVAEPRPTFCICIDDRVVGWVDYDRDDSHTWLVPGEVNVGYALHADVRGRGLATRAVQLLMHHLAQATDVCTATLAINHDNQWSLAVARRAGFTPAPDLPGGAFFKRRVPPLTYTDGTITIRPPRVEDAEESIAAIDDVQIDWLWLSGHRESWEAMTPEEQLGHQRNVQRRNAALFETGPKWGFAIEVGGEYIGHVDCDLANPHVPDGEANVSYSSHPAHRGDGHISAAVRLILDFVTEHTGAREAHILVEIGNEASFRVARAVRALEVGRHVDEEGHTMVRHVISLGG